MTKTLNLAGLMILILCSSSIHAGQYNQIINIGDALPAFTQLPGIDGNQLSSTDIKEDVLVLVILANHCPWVKGMDQDLVQLVDSFKEQSVKVVAFGVNLREDDRLAAMKVHAEKNGYNFSYVFDESQQLGRSLGATRTPEYFVFNQDRKLTYMGLLYNSPAKMNADGSIRHINGEVSEHYVSDAIKATLAGNPVAVPETRAHGCSVKYE
ncbi:redoxin family protein [Marinicella litoralis]|uniref:Peroxiredoxin n=1 Tax=Marinicella litoralis TaxID=644220 RepID=A0A4R6XR88_9GAMM|nr:redoxin family protein [Marinicella litoralis]TDR22392.1 peroxiredoxin [Marinicella litoralis]